MKPGHARVALAVVADVGSVVAAAVVIAADMVAAAIAAAAAAVAIAAVAVAVGAAIVAPSHAGNCSQLAVLLIR